MSQERRVKKVATFVDEQTAEDLKSLAAEKKISVYQLLQQFIEEGLAGFVREPLASIAPTKKPVPPPPQAAQPIPYTVVALPPVPTIWGHRSKQKPDLPKTER